MTPPVLVQAAHAQWVSGTTITIPLASPTLAGSTVVIYNPSPSSATAISSIAAIAGVTPSAVVQSHVSRNAEIWAAVNVAAGAISVTVTLVGTGNTAVEPYVEEWSGVTAIDTAGTSKGGAGGNSTTPATGNITPTAAFGAVILTVARFGAAYVSGPTGGFSGVLYDVSPRDYVASLSVANSAGPYATSYVIGSATWEMAFCTLLGTAWTPAALAIATQPGPCVSGHPIVPAVVINALTNGSTIDPTYTGNVTAQRLSGSATLGGTVTVAAVAGVASFGNLVETGVGSCTIRFTAATYASVDSAAFVVTHPATNARLVLGPFGEQWLVFVNGVQVGRVLQVGDEDGPWQAYPFSAGSDELDCVDGGTGTCFLYATAQQAADVFGKVAGSSDRRRKRAIASIRHPRS